MAILTRPISVRMPEPVKAAVEKAARESFMTTTQYVLTAVREKLARDEYMKGDPR